MPVTTLILGMVLMASTRPACAEVVQVAEPGSAPATASMHLAGFIASVWSSPAVQAADQRTRAARRLVGAAGRLPDPMVGGGVARKSNLGERYPMWDVMVDQELPRWGARDADRSMASADALLAEAEFRRQLGDVAADVAQALSEAMAARASLVLIEGQVTRTKVLEQAVMARIAAGTAGLADRLALATQVTNLQLDADRMSQALANAESDARGWLGLSGPSALPAFVVPDPDGLQIGQVPGVLIAQAQASLAEAALLAARSQAHPSTVVGLRFERESPDAGNEDTLGVEFRIGIPVYRSSLNAGEDGARARRRAAERDRAGATFRAQTLLDRQRRAEAVADRAREAADANRIRLDAEYQALVRAAGAQGGVGVIAVLALLDRITSIERQVIDAEAAKRSAQAEIWRLAPPLSATTAP